MPMNLRLYPYAILMPVEHIQMEKCGEAHNPETHLIPLILQVPNGKREYISIFGND